MLHSRPLRSHRLRTLAAAMLVAGTVLVALPAAPAHAATPADAGMSVPTFANDPSPGVNRLFVRFNPVSPAVTGTVDFSEDGKVLQAGVPVPRSGLPWVDFPHAAAGDHTFTAVYSGDVNYAAATTSAVIPIRVPVTVALHSYENPSIPGQRVHILATVEYTDTSAPSGPTGTVSFYDYASPNPLLATAQVNQYRQALLSITTLSAASHTITAMYSGDGYYGNTQFSGSGTTTQTVQPATPNRRFVNQLFDDVLYRAGDESDAATLASRLDQHTLDRTQLALAMVESDEYIADQIEISYNAHLGRDADDPGMAFWLGYIQKGATYENLEVSFLGAVEYYRQAGGTSDHYLDALYADVFGRTIDDGGRAFWDGQLAKGTPLWVVAMSVVMSNEAMSNRVVDMYTWYLGRKPDAAGLAYWVGRLQHGTRDETLAAFLAGSDEYWAETQS